MGDFGNNKSFIISDETVLMELRPWQREVLKFSKEIIGTVKTSLVGDRSEESTLGNFVTDAIVNYVSNSQRDNSWEGHSSQNVVRGWTISV